MISKILNFFLANQQSIFKFAKNVTVLSFQIPKNTDMKQPHPFDCFSQQALQTLHRYRAVMFSPTLFWGEPPSGSGARTEL
ncbi:hypothetical protein M1B74_03490 [Bacteroides pyogenes]|nr:hypothetical protein [Bacteroides pyogenes]MBB3895100.1 hypothetical protein [Bacteroides pyogenes]SUV32101.1 Uncharacterised protein [Bacteroides pyogenes]